MSTTTTPHTQTAYKDTPIGKIPADWEVKKLGDLGIFSKGKGILKDQVKEIGLPCIRYGEIYTSYDYVAQEFKSFIDENVAKVSKEINKGDVLFAGSGETVDEIGKSVAYLGELKAYAGGDVIVYSPNQDLVSSACLSYTLDLNSIRKQKRYMGQGNSVVHIYPSDLAKLQIPLPPLSEQKRIAEVLSTWDKAIQLTEQLIRQKEQRKKWLVQNLLTGKMRLKGFSGVWNECKLGDLFDRITRKNSEGNKNVVTISAQRGFVKQTDFFNKSVASEVLDNYYLVFNGEFCYNKSYSNGYPWGATKRLNNFDKAVVTTLYICFCIKDNTTTNSDFFEQYFEANLLDKGLTQIAHEGGRAHGLLNVTPNDFFSLKVKVPDFKQQTAIAEVLQTADREIELLKAKAEQLKEQKKGLMQQLLTGEKRLNQNLQD